MKITTQFANKILFPAMLLVLLPHAASAQWSSKYKLSGNSVSASLNENMATCLAVSNDTVHVVWTDRHAAGSAVYYRRSADTGLTWNTAVPITDTTGAAGFSAIAVSGSTVHVVWMDSLLGHRASFYKRSLDGGNTWGPNVCLDSISAFWPGLAAWGSLVVVSLNKQQDSANTEVYFRRSINNGSTWDTLTRISNATNRSEDPAIAVKDSDVYLSWNDKRSGTMEIYYRRSKDAGVTWGTETALTSSDSYTTMVSLDRNYVDVVYALNNSGNFDAYLRESTDTGSTFGTGINITNTASPSSEAYPYMVRDSMNLHIVYLKFGTGGGPFYLYSGDGGATWDTAYSFGAGGQPYIAYTGCALHVIYGDSGAIYYTRNSMGNSAGHNCNTIGPSNVIAASHIVNGSFSSYPNPVYDHLNISFNEDGAHTMDIYDFTGRLMSSMKCYGKVFTIPCDALPAGVYFIKVFGDNGIVTARFIKE